MPLLCILSCNSVLVPGGGMGVQLNQTRHSDAHRLKILGSNFRGIGG